MPVIRTVRGDIDPDTLGITYPHEHLMTQPPANTADQDLCLDSEQAAMTELGHFYAAEGRAIVDMTPRDYGRMPGALRRLSGASGVAIICVTGWHKEKFSLSWVSARSIDDLANEMIREIETGIDDTGIRAGLIKAASSLNQITPAEEKVFRAAALAHRKTCAPISTHTEVGTMACEQIELLRSEGVDPRHLIIGHTDRNLDWDYHVGLLQTGVTLIYDQLSKEKYQPDSQRVEFILRLVKAGFGKQLMLSGDLARKSYWPSYGNWGGPGLTYILWRFVPWLHSEGLADSAIDDMLVHTPARVLQLPK
jgi:phosphotriesterase-related protein